MRTSPKRYTITANWLIISLLAVIAAPAAPAQQTIVKPVADGVRLVQQIETDQAGPLIVSALKIDPRNPQAAVRAALGRDTVWAAEPAKGRETVSALAARRGALAAINADYFGETGDPLGLAIVDGELVSEPFPGRAVFGLTHEGSAIFDSLAFTGAVTSGTGQVRALDGLNRPRGQNELILFSPTFGTSTNTARGTSPMEAVLTGVELPVRANRDVVATVQSIRTGENSEVPRDGLILAGSGRAADWMREILREGDTLRLRVDLLSASGKDWSTVTQAVGGGPWLVKDRRVYITAEEEGFNKAFYAARHPRTAVGVTSGGELLLVTVDGRQSVSRGATLAEMASVMQRLGAVAAINLDGGGSSTLSVRGTVTNSPSGGQERPVASTILILGNPKPSALTFRFEEPCIEVTSGQPARPTLLNEQTRLPLDIKDAQNVVWGATGGIGFVSQEGRFIPIKAGTGTIVAMLGEARAVLPVTVLPAAPARIEAKVEPDISGGTNRNQIVVKIVDVNGNPIPNHGFRLSGRAAEVDAPLGMTDSTGQGTMGVTWEFRQGGIVTITVGPVTREVKQPVQAAEPLLQ